MQKWVGKLVNLSTLALFLVILPFGATGALGGDMEPPMCQVIVQPDPLTDVEFRIQDTGSGLSAIDVIDTENASVFINLFAQGVINVIRITVSKIDKTKGFSVVLESVDMAGNVSRCQYSQMRPKPPVVSGVSLTSDNTPTWAWTSAGGGIGVFRLKLDEEDFGVPIEANTFTPHEPLSDGPHILYVQERDDTGIWSDSGSFSIVVDTTPPAAPIVSGPSSTPFRTPTWLWSSGGGGNCNYRFKLDSNDFSDGAPVTIDSSFTPSTELADGGHILYVQERDEAGNWSGSGWFPIYVDQTSPAPSYTYVKLRWDPSAHVAGHKIYYKTGCSGPNYNGTGADQGPSPILVATGELDDPSNPEYTITGLDPFQVYFFRLTGYASDGQESDYSDEIFLAPAVVSDLESGERFRTDKDTVSLTLIGVPCKAVETMVAEDAAFSVNPTTWKPFAPVSSFTFSDTNEGERTTYVKFVDDTQKQIGWAKGKITIDSTGSNSDSGNDNDSDKMADDWESENGVDDPDGDPDFDFDSLNNLQEHRQGTDRQNWDTDGDGLPDAWEVTYGLDPNDSAGDNGADGDFDKDGWTNYEEYANSSDPASDSSPDPTPPAIVEAIPHDGAGIAPDSTRISNISSFAVLIEDSDGIDITDTASVKFTVDDGIRDVYERDLSDTAVVRAIKLTSDADSQVTKLWVVYDRAEDDLYWNNYDFGRLVNIRVDAKDRREDWMVQASYDLRIESVGDHIAAEAAHPVTGEFTEGDSTTLTVASTDALDGLQVVYNNSESVAPYLSSSDEIPPLDISGVTAIGLPVNLQPPTVFDSPVRLIIPFPGRDDVTNLSLYIYNGRKWVYACGSYHGSRLVQYGAHGWLVPGSLVYRDSTSTPALEIQVYGSLGIQAGY